MKLTVEVDSKQILDGFTAATVAEYFKQHRDIDLLLLEIGFSAIIQYLREQHASSTILDELVEVGDAEARIQELQLWVLKQKQSKEVS